MTGNLPEIAAAYHPASRDHLVRLAREIDERQSAEVIDVAAVAADVAIDDITSLGLEPDANPELWRAFNMAYPNVDPSSLVGRSAESMRGFVNGVKGKYFEVLVERRLNEDRVFGEIVLSPGQRAVLATSPTQKGWDLQVIEEDGSVAEYIQLKATARLSYIKQALENGFSVATTAEIDATSDEIIGTPLTSQELGDETGSQLGEAAETPMENALDHLAEFGIDAVPVFAPVVIVFTEGRAMLVGRSTVKAALEEGARRMGTASAFSALGAGLSALDAGVISVPATVAARIGWSRYANFVVRGAYLAPLNVRLRDLVTGYAG